MDIFSHALLPYLIASNFRLDKRLLAALVLGGIAPDLDFGLVWVNYIYPTNLLIVHRGFTHTIFFGFFAALFTVYIASRAPIKNAIAGFVEFDIGLTMPAIAIAYVGVLSHLFLDYLTTRGAPIFYPIDPSRISADLFFHTEITVALASLAIVLYLFKMPYKIDKRKTTMIFLAVLLVIGAIRIEGKEASQSSFGDRAVKSYPDAGLFDWTIVEENDEAFQVYEYNVLVRVAEFNSSYPRLSVQGEVGLKKAMAMAEELPQVRLFRWRAYAVAVNASLQGTTWYLEYYDPTIRAEMKNSSSLFKLIGASYASIKVRVDGEGASVAKE